MHGLAREPAPDAPPALLGIDDEADLADVAGPPVQRHDRDRADDLAVVDGDHARRARARPRGDDVGVVDILLEERAVGIRDLGEEALSAASSPAAMGRNSITTPSVRDSSSE